MLHASMLLAQVVEDAAKKPDGEQQGPPAASFLPLIGMIAVMFYFLMYLPNRKEKQQRQALMSALKKNDKVVTIGGIIGVVQNIKEGTDEVTIRSDETRLLVQRSS